MPKDGKKQSNNLRNANARFYARMSAPVTPGTVTDRMEVAVSFSHLCRVASDTLPDTEITPEQNLVIGVIDRALMDCQVEDYNRPGTFAALEEREADARDAKRFIDSDDCADLLEMLGCRDETLDRIRAHAEQLYSQTTALFARLRGEWKVRYGYRRSRYLPCKVH